MAYAIMRCEKSLPRVTWRVPFHTLTENERHLTRIWIDTRERNSGSVR